jgi:hypothetical protein
MRIRRKVFITPQLWHLKGRPESRFRVIKQFIINY